jgi:hypothetical protein
MTSVQSLRQGKHSHAVEENRRKGDGADGSNRERVAATTLSCDRPEAEADGGSRQRAEDSDNISEEDVAKELRDEAVQYRQSPRFTSKQGSETTSLTWLAVKHIMIRTQTPRSR